MKAMAAITRGTGTFTIEPVEVGRPAADEIMVELKASGVCHTDLDSLSWGRPLILGHEGAGIIVSVGDGVADLAAGDHVILNWAMPCGICFQCEQGNHNICETYSPVTGARKVDGTTAGHATLDATLFEGRGIERSFNIGTLSTHTVVRKEAVVKVPTNIPFASASILGCGVMTGVGSAVNVAKVSRGSSVAVLGAGGVGLNVIQGCRIAGAERIIAMDLSAQRLEMSKFFGATHTIEVGRSDQALQNAIADARQLCDGRGADFAFECTGNPQLGAAPLALVRNAGMAVQVSGIEQEIIIDMNLFEWDKIYINPLYGKCNPMVDFPRLFDLYHRGELFLDELVTKTYSLESLQSVFDDMLHGRIAKGVVIF
jgi:S-(hydroxymethyl)glutathione dehydrogenase/alcohol dehydrogenase